MKWLIHGGFVIAAIFVVVLYVVSYQNFVPTIKDEVNQEVLKSTLVQLQNTPQDFTNLTIFFKEVAREQGGVFAFAVLGVAALPPDTDTHLLGHTIGDELYKQQGLSGMQYCTHEFRNACSHSIVIGALLEDGLGVFDDVNAVCQQAPGGSGAYTMCFHGFGHGVLAYADYELPDAIELCKRTGTPEYQHEEFRQCVGGVVMEMRDGVHDPDVWEAKVEKYIDAENPLAICQAEYMPEDAKHFCYTYITPYIFDAAGMKDSVSEQGIAESFAYCTQAEASYIDTCYEGIGKELIVLAQDRDIRSIDNATNEQLQQTIDWCYLGSSVEVVTPCLTEVVDSLFWGGENDPRAATRFCSLLVGTEYESVCYESYSRNVGMYISEPHIERYCQLLPETERAACPAG